MTKASSTPMKVRPSLFCVIMARQLPKPEDDCQVLHAYLNGRGHIVMFISKFYCELNTVE